MKETRQMVMATKVDSKIFWDIFFTLIVWKIS